MINSLLQLKEGKLTINIPNIKHYDEFVQQLYQNKLLPEHPVKQQVNIESPQKQEEKKFNPSPLSMDLKRK